MDISKIPLVHRNIKAVLERALADGPDRLAVRDANSTFTYSQAWSSALAFGAGLEALSVARQTPVLFMLDNHADNILCWLGAALTGRVEVPINAAYIGDMLAHVINDSGARIILIEESYFQRLLDIATEIPGLRTVVLRRGNPGKVAEISTMRDAVPAAWSLHEFSSLLAAGRTEPADLKPWDLISISYTSGTTGRSKGVLCPHAHAFGHATGDGLGITRPGETRFVVLPQFHIAGRWGGAYNALAQMACGYIADKFHASTYWEEARQVNASTSQLIGSMAEFLMRQPSRDSDRTHGLREVSIMPLPLDYQEWSRRFGVVTPTAYGSTEVGSVLMTMQPVARSVGRVRDGYELRVVDENDIEVPEGAVGELAVRPVLPWTSGIGYHNRPEQTASVWRNGWFHSGDALRRDCDGNFFFVDRVDDALRRRGENISSAEVEFFINEHPHVLSSAVIGVPSDYLEDEIMAVVVLRETGSITQLDLVRDIAQKMPHFMVPRYIRFVNELPRTPTAKVQKSLLRATGMKDAWDSEAVGFKPKRG